MKFSYKARTKDGKLETGVIESYSKEAAVLLLQKYSIFVISLKEQKVKTPLLANIELRRKVSKKELAVFFRQLSLMLESHVPVVQSLLSLAAQIRKPSFKDAVSKIAKFVEEGVPLSEAFAHYPSIFDAFYVSVVKSGEASGKISQALYYVSDHLEKESDIIAQVRQALVYPAFVLSVLLVVVGIIIKQLIPKITELIKESGVQPPPFTIFMLHVYRFLEQYWWIMVLGLFVLVGAGLYYFTTQEGKKNFSKIFFRIPIIREFLKKIFLTRFCSNTSTLLVAGISINRALKITEEAVNNVVYKGIISDIGQRVSEGEKMSSAMSKHQDYFPPFVIQMVRVGEETGKLDEVLREVVDFYQKEIKRTIDLFSTLLEPIIIILLGIVITVLAISVLSSLYGAIGTL